MHNHKTIRTGRGWFRYPPPFFCFVGKVGSNECSFVLFVLAGFCAANKRSFGDFGVFFDKVYIELYEYIYAMNDRNKKYFRVPHRMWLEESVKKHTEEFSAQEQRDALEYLTKHTRIVLSSSTIPIAQIPAWYRVEGSESKNAIFEYRTKNYVYFHVIFSRIEIYVKAKLSRALACEIELQKLCTMFVWVSACSSVFSSFFFEFFCFPDPRARKSPVIFLCEILYIYR